jgi:hypothetical protein
MLRSLFNPPPSPTKRFRTGREGPAIALLSVPVTELYPIRDAFEARPA